MTAAAAFNLFARAATLHAARSPLCCRMRQRPFIIQASIMIPVTPSHERMRASPAAHRSRRALTAALPRPRPAPLQAISIQVGAGMGVGALGGGSSRPGRSASLPGLPAGGGPAAARPARSRLPRTPPMPVPAAGPRRSRDRGVFQSGRRVRRLARQCAASSRWRPGCPRLQWRRGGGGGGGAHPAAAACVECAPVTCWAQCDWCTAPGRPRGARKHGWCCA